MPARITTLDTTFNSTFRTTDFSAVVPTHFAAVGSSVEHSCCTALHAALFAACIPAFYRSIAAADRTT